MGDCMGGLSSALQKSKRTCNLHPHQYPLHYSQQYFLYCLNHRLPHSFIPTPLTTSTTLTQPPQRPPLSPLFYPSSSRNNHVQKIQKIHSNPFPKKMHIHIKHICLHRHQTKTLQGEISPHIRTVQDYIHNKSHH